MGQLDLRSQLYIRNFRLLWHAFRSDNNIIYTCIKNALCNLNSGLGYNLAFYGYRYNITMSDKLCIARISQYYYDDPDGDDADGDVPRNARRVSGLQRSTIGHCE